MLDHVSITVHDLERSTELYKKTLAPLGSRLVADLKEYGAKDNGKPGLRPEYHENYYGAFVFDFDGHNIEACCHKRE